MLYKDTNVKNYTCFFTVLTEEGITDGSYVVTVKSSLKLTLGANSCTCLLTHGGGQSK